MGRHYCQLCCSSHALPPISRPGLGFDAAVVPHTAARASVLLADLDSEAHGRNVFQQVEMPCAASDFAEEHTISRLILQVDSLDSLG